MKEDGVEHGLFCMGRINESRRHDNDNECWGRSEVNANESSCFSPTVHQTRYSLCSLDYALRILTVVSGTPFAPRARALLRSPAVQLPTIHSRDP